MRAPPEDGKDPGEVISGWYDIQNGQVVVWERSGGAPIGRAPYTEGDDPKVIADKMAYIKQMGLGGTVIWSLDGDDGTLISAVYNGLH